MVEAKITTPVQETAAQVEHRLVRADVRVTRWLSVPARPIILPW
jgi:hypothetical protein